MRRREHPAGRRGGAGAGTARRGGRGDHDRRDGETRERIATIAVTLRAFARATGAEAAMLLLDRGDGGQPFVVECPADGPVMLVEGGHAVELDPDRLAADPLPLPALPAPLDHPFAPEALRPALTLCGGADESALAHAAALASAMRALAALFPGRSVLTATFPTADDEIPFQLAVRSGDPIVASLGSRQYELPPGWPA